MLDRSYSLFSHVCTRLQKDGIKELIKAIKEFKKNCEQNGENWKDKAKRVLTKTYFTTQMKMTPALENIVCNELVQRLKVISESGRFKQFSDKRVQIIGVQHSNAKPVKLKLREGSKVLFFKHGDNLWQDWMVMEVYMIRIVMSKILFEI